jgi:WD40 repeat protein
MSRTLDAFQTEWFQLHGAQPAAEPSAPAPTVYIQYQALLTEVATLRETAANATAAALAAKGTWLQFKKERDTHRMHHRRLVTEKEALVADLARLKKHVDEYAPVLSTLQKKYEAAVKDRMLLKMEKTKLQQQLASSAPGGVDAAEGTGAASKLRTNGKLSSISTAMEATRSSAAKTGSSKNHSLDGTGKQASPTTGAGFHARLVPTSVNPFVANPSPRAALTSATLTHSYKAHSLPVAAVALSPVAAVLATAGDDEAWKVWTVPRGDLVMVGEGHSDWLSSCDFHPTSATLLATAGVDQVAKIWNLGEQQCAVKLAGHTQPLWDVRFHTSGLSVLTASMDHTARLWDAATGAQLSVFRGHADSVNKARWLPFSQVFATASGDKTVSLWDARSGLCTQTLVGHYNAVQALDVALTGRIFATGDADGTLKVWDVATGTELYHVSLGAAVNAIKFDPSGEGAVVALDNGRVEILGVDPEVHRWIQMGELQTPDANVSIQDVTISVAGDLIVGGAADGHVLFWQM